MVNLTLSDRIKRGKNGKFKLAINPLYNIVKVRTTNYQLSYLTASIKSSKGGNSSVFLLVDPEHRNDETKHLVIKICNKSNEESDIKYKRRFQREILALDKAKKSNKQYIVTHFDYGMLTWNDALFPYYIMEKGDCDLASFLNDNPLNIDQKILLCSNVIKAFKDLHSLGIYHRDIKHDNILMFGTACKMADLGLVKFREDDLEFISEEEGERIGAFGWESPETMNKYLTEKNDRFSFNCEINDQSDIFQLGKLFWYILQGNLPIGQITPSDFLVNDQSIFDIIFWMLQHGSKNRRPDSIDEVEEHFSLIASKYAT